MGIILEKNLQNVSENKKYIVDYFRDFKTKVKNENNGNNIEVGVEIIEDRKILYSIKDGKQFQLDSLYDNAYFLERWKTQFENDTYRSRYLLFGLGNGMYVNKLLQSMGEQAQIIVVEPSPKLFELAMQHFDMSDLLKSEQVSLIINGLEGKRFVEYLWEELKYEDLQGAVCRSYLNYPQMFEKEYEEFNETIKHYTNTLEANHSVMIRMGERYFENSIMNYPYFVEQKSLIALSREMPKDIPGILVAAGPSLDKNMKELKKAKNKAFILAVDSAARAMVKNSIIPDAVISVDAMKSRRHFEEEEVQKIPLITNLYASKEPLALHTGDKYFLHDDNEYIKTFFDKIQKKLPQVHGGGSVATDGYALLEQMKFENIILVGVDLAYTDNKTHTKDSVRGERSCEKKEIQAPLQVEDIYGNMIGTSYEFQIYHDWFLEEIANNKDYNVIDATEGGAKIHGTQIMNLKDAIAKYCVKEINIDKIMESMPSRLSVEEQKMFEIHMQNIPTELKGLNGKVDKVLSIYNKMLKMIQMKRGNKAEVVSLMDKTKKIGTEVEAAPVFYYVLTNMQKELQEKMDNNIFASKVGEEEAVTSLKQAIMYFEIMKNTLKDSIKKSEEWIKLTENEER